MLDVLTLEEAVALMRDSFFALQTPSAPAPLSAALGRVLRQDVIAGEDVPGFTRSTVDGYAVAACDTFGCSESSPALLTCVGEVEMGASPAWNLSPGQCAKVPTGGVLPAGADAMVMLEYASDYGGGLIAVEKPAAPGQHLIFAGDDVPAGRTVLPAGRLLCPRDIGVLAALGYASVSVAEPPRVAILSTGDELVPPEKTPGPGEIRDVNGPMLLAECLRNGADPLPWGIVPDDEDALWTALAGAAAEADVVLLSGGSSAGEKDAAARVLAREGTLLFHGLAVKPGKPTLAGYLTKEGRRVPVIGLPGHPAAACCVCCLLVRPLLCLLLGRAAAPVTHRARLAAAVPSNHGREEYVPVQLQGQIALPIMGKSGLIAPLALSDGYIRIPRDTEGYAKDAAVTVIRWEEV